MTFNVIGSNVLGQKDCKFSPDGSLIASTGRTYYTMLWDAKTGNLKAKLNCETGKPSCCDFSPDGLNLITFNDMGDLDVWNLETYSKIVTLKGHDRNGVDCCTYSHDGKNFASVGRDGLLKLWDLRGKQTSIRIKDYNLYKSCYE